LEHSSELDGPTGHQLYGISPVQVLQFWYVASPVGVVGYVPAPYPVKRAGIHEISSRPVNLMQCMNINDGLSPSFLKRGCSAGRMPPPWGCSGWRGNPPRHSARTDDSSSCRSTRCIFFPHSQNTRRSIGNPVYSSEMSSRRHEIQG